jgi:hypothetical protein
MVDTLGSPCDKIMIVQLKQFATHVTNFNYCNDDYVHSLIALRPEEFELELDTDKPYRNSQNRINALRDELTRLLKKLKRKGKRICVYGVSTRATQSCKSAALTTGSSKSQPSVMRTSMVRARSERTFPLSAQPNPGP